MLTPLNFATSCFILAHTYYVTIFVNVSSMISCGCPILKVCQVHVVHVY